MEDAGNRGGIAAYRRLRDAASQLLALRELAPLLDRCGALAEELLRADACSVSLFDERARAVVPLLTRAAGNTVALEPLPLDLFDGRIWESIVAGRSIVVAGGMILDGGEPLVLAEPQAALTAMLTPLPLLAPHRGVLWVARIHGEGFTTEDQHLAEAIAELLSFGLRNVYDSGGLAGTKGAYREAALR